jgi:hypothetical protein
MLSAGIVSACVVLAALAFLLPRLSRHPGRGMQRSLGTGTRTAGRAPGPLGRLFSKPFRSGSRALGRSGAAGRRTRRRFPF